jgi:hypothetical protein
MLNFITTFAPNFHLRCNNAITEKDWYKINDLFDVQLWKRKKEDYLH